MIEKEEKEEKKRDFPSMKKGNSNVFDFSNFIQNKISKQNNIKPKGIPDLELTKSPLIYKEDMGKIFEKRLVPNIKLSELKDKNRTIETKKETFPSPRSARKIICHGFKTQAGVLMNGERKKNQDSHFTRLKFLGQDDFHISSVLDGHGIIFTYQGTYGNLVSNYVKDFLIQFYSKRELYTKYISLTDRQPKSQYTFYNEKFENLNEYNIYKKLTNDKYEIIRSSFIKAEECLGLMSNIDVSLSGTTCVMIFIISKF